MKQVNGRPEGFALRDLCFLLALTSCMAGLMVARGGRGEIDSKTVRCLANLRQHGMALQLYAADHKSFVPLPETTVAGPTRPPWLGKFTYMDYSPRPENWDPNVAMGTSPMNPYTKTNLSIWRCPADPTMVRNNTGEFVPRVRTYSMSQTFGSGNWLPTPQYRIFQTISSIPDPAQIWMVMDEHPDSINDAALAVAMTEPGASSGRIVDFPGSHHQGGVGMLFSDGHVEEHTWKGRQIRARIRNNNSLFLNVQTVDSLQDMIWLSSRTSIRREVTPGP